MLTCQAMVIAAVAVLPVVAIAQTAGKQKPSPRPLLESAAGDCQFKLLELSSRNYQLVSESDSSGNFGTPKKKPLPAGRVLISVKYTVICPTEAALRPFKSSRSVLVMASGGSASLFGRTTISEGKELTHDALTSEDFPQGEIPGEIRLGKASSVSLVGLKLSK